MRLFAVTLVSLLASVVSGISVPGLPSCASPCLSGLGGCSQLDVSCICNNKKLINNLSCCVSKKCDKADQKKVISLADGICTGTGANLPSEASCSSSSSSSSSSNDGAASQGIFAGAGLGVGLAALAAAL